MKAQLTISNELNEEKELVFPVLATANLEGREFVVMFSSYNYGTVLIAHNRNYTLGREYNFGSTGNLKDKECWTILPKGSIVTLTQEEIFAK